MALVGGPSGWPVMLMAPAMAWAIHSKLLYSAYGPVLPKPLTEAWISRGFSRESVSQPRPRRSRAPGPRFSTTTSAFLAISRKSARPRSDLRLRVTPFLFELRSRKNQASSPRLSESALRPGSPVGGSILMTSAPSHASIWVALGPASYCVRSRTRIPSRALGIGCRLLGRVRREPHSGRPRLVVGHHVAHGRLPGGIRALQGRPDLVWLLDQLTVRAQLHGHTVIARAAEIPAGLGQGQRPRGVGRPSPVVRDDDDDGDTMPHRRVDLHRVDAERPVAVEHEHLRVRLGDLGAHAEGQAHAHATEGAGVQPVPRHIGRNRLPPEVQDLLSVDHEDGVALEEVAHLLAEPEGMDGRVVRGHRLLLLGVLLGVEHAQLADPRRILPGI